MADDFVFSAGGRMVRSGIDGAPALCSYRDCTRLARFGLAWVVDRAPQEALPYCAVHTASLFWDLRQTPASAAADVWPVARWSVDSDGELRMEP